MKYKCRVSSKDYATFGVHNAIRVCCISDSVLQMAVKLNTTVTAMVNKGVDLNTMTVQKTIVKAASKTLIYHNRARNSCVIQKINENFYYYDDGDDGDNDSDGDEVDDDGDDSDGVDDDDDESETVA